jgi:hypothetical protein
MNKRLILILALAFVIGFSAYAYAEVQNIKVGGDITTLALSRYGFNLRNPETDASGLGLIANIKLAADLTDDVGAVIVLKNEKVWGAKRTETGDGDVILACAFVTLKEFLYSPLTLKIGQMPVRLGSGLIIADPDTNRVSSGPFADELGDLSSRKAFTGVVGILDYDPTTITLAGLKAKEGNLDEASDDANAYAVNVAYDFGTMDAIGDLYYVLKNVDKQDINNIGVRVVGSPLDQLTLSSEFAYQTERRASGQKGHRSDTALLLGATYALPDVAMSPTIGLDYGRLSNNWDPMFEGITPADIVNAILPNTNAQVIGVTATAKPVEDVTLKLRYANLKLVEAISILPGWAKRADYTMTDKKDVGDEIDLNLTYDYTEDVQLGLSIGYFDPGDAFAKSNREEATQVIGSMKVTF